MKAIISSCLLADSSACFCCKKACCCIISNMTFDESPAIMAACKASCFSFSSRICSAAACCCNINACCADALADASASFFCLASSFKTCCFRMYSSFFRVNSRAAAAAFASVLIFDSHSFANFEASALDAA